MYRYMLISICLACLSGCAHSDAWSRQDTVLQSIVTATLIADAIQTSEIQYHPHIYENGPIAKHVLGRQPGTAETWQYFGSVIVFNYLVARALPAKWRPFWQGATIAYETDLLISNCVLGLGRICWTQGDPR